MVSLFVAGGITGNPAPPNIAEQADQSNIAQLGRLLFTDFAFAFEATAILLTIAVVGAVLLTRRPEPAPEPEPAATSSPRSPEAAS